MAPVPTLRVVRVPRRPDPRARCFAAPAGSESAARFIVVCGTWSMATAIEDQHRRDLLGPSRYVDLDRPSPARVAATSGGARCSGPPCPADGSGITTAAPARPFALQASRSHVPNAAKNSGGRRAGAARRELAVPPPLPLQLAWQRERRPL